MDPLTVRIPARRGMARRHAPWCGQRPTRSARHAWTLAVLLLTAAAPAAAEPAGLKITGFAVDLPSTEFDDAVELLNPTGDPVLLDAWRLTDGEGVLAWPAGAVLPPGQRILVAGNATAWRLASGTAADWAILTEAGVPALRVLSGTFQLARGGDEILLLHGDHVVDAVVYGTSRGADGWSGPPVPLGGSAFLRWYVRALDEAGAPVDTDTAADWTTPKPRFVGATDHALVTFEVPGPIVAYLAPDASRATVRAFVTRAQEGIRLNVYSLTDAQVVEDLAQAARRGVEVRILLDERPVGLDAEARRLREGHLGNLAAAGADVHLSLHARIAYNHAKYAVADGALVLVQTENLVRSGLPPDVGQGNRGWGVVVEDTALATWFSRVFDADHAPEAWRAEAWTPQPDAAAQPPRVAVTTPTGRPGQGAAWLEGPHRVTPVLAPDHTLGPDDPVLRSLGQAERSIRVLQLNLPPVWADRAGTAWTNAYLEALVDAAARGVEVRVLLDGHFLDPQRRHGDNAATADHLNALGLAHLEARLWGPDAFGVLHAKGFVVDDDVTLVGSMNWNLNSVARNREASLLIQSPTVAAYFAAAFDADWANAGGQATGGRDGPELLLIGTVITVGLVLAALAAWRRP